MITTLRNADSRWILAAWILASPLGCTQTRTQAIDEDATSGPDASCLPDTLEPAQWQVLDLCRANGQLLSVSAPAHDDVWVSGANGQLLHFDGCDWHTISTETTADLWWVHVSKTVVFVTGADGTVLRVQRAAPYTVEPMESTVSTTLYGVHATDDDTAWAVGFDPLDAESASTVLRLLDGVWSETPLPPGVDPKTDLFKVWGRAVDDVYFVGRDGLFLRFDGTELNALPSPPTDWVTITGTSTEAILVGGRQAGEIARYRNGQLETITPDSAPPLQGVCVGPDGSALATGLYGALLQRQIDGSWLTDLTAPLDLFNPAEPPVEGCTTFIPDYHACAFDERGGLYVVGGGFASGLRDGALLYYGPTLPPLGID